MRQFHRMKAEHPEALLFFRMGDFYELFFDDAVVAFEGPRDRTHLPLEGQATASRFPMCGVPYHAATGLHRPPREPRASGSPSASRWRIPAPPRASCTARWCASSLPGTQPRGLRPRGQRRRRTCMALEPGPSSVGAAWLDATTGEFFAAEWRRPGAASTASGTRSARRAPREILVRGERRACPGWLLRSRPSPRGRSPHAPVEDRSFEAGAGAPGAPGPVRGRDSLEAFGCESLPRATPPPPARCSATSGRPRSGTSPT